MRDSALFGDGRPHYVCGPRIHEFLQEMHQEVFANRPELLLTMGEMPGVTVEEAVLFTDPARGEGDMVFQLLATVLHLHRGTPYVYQGEELAMTNAHFTRIDQYRDIESVNHYAEALAHGQADEGSLLEALRAVSRDNARTPLRWDATENAGFTTGEPWIVVNPNYRSGAGAGDSDHLSSRARTSQAGRCPRIADVRTGLTAGSRAVKRNER